MRAFQSEVRDQYSSGFVSSWVHNFRRPVEKSMITVYTQIFVVDLAHQQDGTGQSGHKLRCEVR